MSITNDEIKCAQRSKTPVNEKPNAGNLMQLNENKVGDSYCTKIYE